MTQRIIFGSGLSSYKDYEGLYKVCKKALENGIRRFDTAPSYRTESVISKAVKQSANELGLCRPDYQIQTKIDPIHMYNGNIRDYFLGKLSEMGLEYIDTLLIHWPLEKYMERTWNSIVALKEEGVAKKIGICNLRLRHLVDYKDKGINPEVLQIERHPLNTFNDEVQWCVNNNVELQDYSPLCKMHPVIRNNADLQRIAEKYGKDIGQIVLRWHIDTNATPIFTSKNLDRIAQYSKIEDFKLVQEEIDAIAKMNCNHKLYLESLVCPGF